MLGRGRLLGLDLVDLALELAGFLLAGAQCCPLRRLGLLECFLAVLEQRVHSGQRAPPDLRIGGQLPVGALELANQPLLLVLGVTEIGQPLEQIGEAARVEDHADQVRVVGLVVADQLLGQELPGPGQPALEQRDELSLPGQVGLSLGELGPIGVEFRLNRVLARAHERDLPLQRGDQAGQLLQAALEVLLAVVLSRQLIAELAEARVGARGHRQRGQDGQGARAGQPRGNPDSGDAPDEDGHELGLRG